jgi:hypothetical protein
MFNPLQPQLLWTSVLAGTMLGGCASLSGPGGLPVEVSATRDSYVADVTRYDRDVGHYFTEDAELTHGVRSYQGRDNIVAQYLVAARPLAGVTFRTVMVSSSDSMVIEEGRWSREQRSAASLSRNGRYKHIWVRQAYGTWQLRSVTLTDDL